MSERDEQRALAKYLDAIGVLWMHPPNEGKRSPRAGAYNKLMGVKSGCPDCIVFSPGLMAPRGVAIELKCGKRKPTPAQEDWLEKLRAIGWKAQVCYGAGEAIEYLQSLGYR